MENFKIDGCGIWLGFKPRHLWQPLTLEMPQNSQKNDSRPGYKASVRVDFARRSSQKKNIDDVS